MKFRKLIMGLLLGFIVFNFTGINAFAAEGTNDNIENSTQTVTGSEVVQTVETTDTAVITDTTDASAADTTTETSDETMLLSETAPVPDDDAEVIDTEETKDTTATEDTKGSDQDTKDNTKKVTTVDKKTVAKEVEVNYTKAQLRLLSALVFCEAQSESYNGKLAVAIVVMNRVKSNQFPDTLKGVIYQRYQFSPVTNGTLNRALAEYDAGRFSSEMEKECIKAAKAALSGEKSITVKGEEKNFSKYLFFSVWLKGATFQLGNHKFK